MDVQRKTLFVVLSDVERGYEAEYERWYKEEHLAERLSCPGFRTGELYRAATLTPGGAALGNESTPAYLATYEVDGPEVLQSAAYRHQVSNPAEWTTRLAPHFQLRVRGTYTQM